MKKLIAALLVPLVITGCSTATPSPRNTASPAASRAEEDAMPSPTIDAPATITEVTSPGADDTVDAGTAASDTADADAAAPGAVDPGTAAGDETSALATTRTAVSEESPAAAHLTAAGWITDDGKIKLRTDSGTGPAEDLCAYLFGPQADVAARANLPASAQLMPVSGLQVSPAGAAVLCAYADGDQVKLALEAGHSDDAWSNGITTLIKDGDVHAVLSYVPDFAGDPLGRDEAEVWLRDVLAKVEH